MSKATLRNFIVEIRGKKMSLTRQGVNPWNKGKTNYKTKPCSEERKRKIGLANSISQIGNSNGFKKGNKFGVKKCSEETKKRVGLANSRTKIEFSCKECNKIKKVRQCEVKERKFCSQKCFHLYSKGENSPHWKGGLSSLREQIKNSVFYRKWRFFIMKRDKFICLVCKRDKEVNGKLQVDHFPKSYAEIVFENKIDSLEKAILCRELWNINNGRTLCENCHKNTDSWGGKNVTRMKKIYFNCEKYENRIKTSSGNKRS